MKWQQHRGSSSVDLSKYLSKECYRGLRAITWGQWLMLSAQFGSLSLTVFQTRIVSVKEAFCSHKPHKSQIWPVWIWTASTIKEFGFKPVMWPPGLGLQVRLHIDLRASLSWARGTDRDLWRPVNHYSETWLLKDWAFLGGFRSVQENSQPNPLWGCSSFSVTHKWKTHKYYLGKTI